MTNLEVMGHGGTKKDQLRIGIKEILQFQYCTSWQKEHGIFTSQGRARGAVHFGPALVGASVNEARQGCEAAWIPDLLSLNPLCKFTALSVHRSHVNVCQCLSMFNEFLWHFFNWLMQNILDLGRVGESLAQSDVLYYEVFWADSCEERMGNTAMVSATLLQPACAYLRFPTRSELRLQSKFIGIELHALP